MILTVSMLTEAASLLLSAKHRKLGVLELTLHSGRFGQYAGPSCP